MGNRLLHPGANTMDIIDVYVNCIKVLRVLDPTDRAVEIVGNPIRQYLW
jgi:anaphase-promoting complex subunit 2